MNRCPVCNAANAVDGGPCDACAKSVTTAPMPAHAKPAKPGNGVFVWVILFLLILLGVALWPYIMWTLAGPMPSLG